MNEAKMYADDYQMCFTKQEDFLEFLRSIGFNKHDEDHCRVARLLNNLGRSKAQYIVKAILAYERGYYGGDDIRENSVDNNRLLELIRQAVAEYMGNADRSLPEKADNGISGKPEREPSEVSETGQPEINMEDLDGILSTLNSFRNEERDNG